jgi:hypothetical protein
MKINAGIISATIALTSDKIEATNPSLDTILLNLWLGLRERITDWRRAQLTNAALREEDIKQRLDWSIRQDLDDEADELRAVISDCNKVKAQAEDRLTRILNYLDPDEFYTQRPQVPDGAGLTAPSEKILDEDDAPEGYKAVPGAWVDGCEGCAFDEVGASCPEHEGERHCAEHSRADRTEVRFIKRT